MDDARGEKKDEQKSNDATAANLCVRRRGIGHAATLPVSLVGRGEGLVSEGDYHACRQQRFGDRRCLSDDDANGDGLFGDRNDDGAVGNS